MREQPKRSFPELSPRTPQADHEQRKHKLRIFIIMLGVSLTAISLVAVLVLRSSTAEISKKRAAIREEAPSAFPHQLLPKRFEIIESLDMGHRGFGDRAVGDVAYVRDPVTGNCFLAAEQYIDNDFWDSNVAYASVPCPTMRAIRAYHGD